MLWSGYPQPRSRFPPLTRLTAMSGGQYEGDRAVNSCSNEAALAYRMGFDSGLEKYCTFEQGQFGGQHGQAPAQSCNGPKWDQYQAGFLNGREIRATNQRLEAIASRLNLTRRHLVEAQSVAGMGPLSKIDNDRINALRSDIADLSSERDSANRRLFTLQSDFEYNRKRKLSSL